jgi:hypothetical protein
MANYLKMLEALRKRNFEAGIRPPEEIADRPGVETRAFGFIPKTYNAEDSTVEATLATENPVRVFDWERFEVVNEVLLMDGLRRMPDQIPLLDSHHRERVGDQLGSTFPKGAKNGKLLGLRQFSRANPKARIASEMTGEGHLRDGSIGYMVNKATWIEEGKTRSIGGRSFTGPLKVATNWEILEDSVTPIGADKKAKVRSEASIYEDFSADASRRRYLEERDMNEKLRKRLEALGLKRDATEEEAWEFFDGLELTERTVTVPPPVAPVTPAPPVVDEGAVKEAGILEERARVAEITQFAEVAGNPTMGQEFIAKGSTAEEARKGLYDWAKENKGFGGGSVHTPEPKGIEGRMAAMSDKSFVRSLNQPLAFAPEVEIPDGPVEMATMRQLALSDPKVWADKMRKAIDAEELGWGTVRDLKALQQALRPVQVQEVVEVDGEVRAVTSSAFPVLCGNMTVAKINAAYDSIPTIGQELVEDFDDAQDNTIIAQIHPLDSKAESYEEGDKYPEITASEATFEIRHKEWGRMVTITQKMITQNRVPDIIRRIDALGKFLAKYVEKLTLSRVCDQYGSAGSPTEPYVYRPKGTGTTLYSASANTPSVRTPSGTSIVNAFADYTDLDNAEIRLATYLDEDLDRLPIDWSRLVLLVPHTLNGLAERLLNSELLPIGANNDINHWGPNGSKRVKLLSSVRLDDISTSVWFLGDFKSQFMRKYAKRMEYVTLGDNTESFLQRGIAWQGRIAVDVEVGASDYVFVVRNTAS